MGKKFTLNEAIQKSKKIHGDKYDYSLINEYKGVMNKYSILCPIHGVWEVSLDNHINKKSKCPKCVGKYHTFVEKIENANKIHKHRYDYSLIVSNFQTMDKVPIICNKHGVFNMLWTNHVHSKQGCPKCKNYRRPIPIDELKQRIIELNLGYNYDWKSYINYFDNNFRIECPQHGWFNQQLSNHLQGQRCPKCNWSKGEECIESFLKLKNISYTNQKTFDGCYNPQTNFLLKFDFFIPHLNLCIEYDGELHFKPIKFFGGKKSFEKAKFLDQIKNKFCEKNKINLLRISYMQFNDIDKILKNIII
jgi:hypothetical protein